MNFPKLLFVTACAFAVFGYGLIVGRYEVFPYQLINSSKQLIAQVYSQKDTLLKIRPTDYLEPARYEGDGVQIYKEDQATPGLTFITGFFDGGNEMRLVRLDGTVVNRWPVKFFDFFPDAKHIQPGKEIPKSEWNVGVHGSVLLPDGSIVFVFTYKGAAKIDRCGSVQWVLPRMAHHSVERSSDGNFWIPSRNYVGDKPQYPNLNPPYMEDVILKVSGNGEILQEISVLEILSKNNLLGSIYWKGNSGDLVHLNDVEELSSDMAAAYPQFQAGDLMLSMRFQHLVMIVDPDTLKVKWYQSGPWKGQHDPDFMENGVISLFNNNDDNKAKGSEYGGSAVMEVDAFTREVKYRYGGVAGQPMFTMDRGKHQRLGGATGNVLVTESRSGRLLEVNFDGEVVWEYINRYDDETVAVLTGAERFPDDYFTVSDWSCNE